MTRREDLEWAVDSIALTNFNSRMGSVVPTTESVALSNGGVYIEAVYLYADMADSTGMVHTFIAEDAAKVVRAFLATVTRVLRHHGGEIRSYDGDRVMAIFIGDDAATKAARAALELKWAVDNIVREELGLLLPAYRASGWHVSHHTGIDMGDVFIVRAGVRNSNDLVSIGDAPNIAAKLSEEKFGRTMITQRVWNAMSYATCFSSNGDKAMWSDPEYRTVGGRSERVRWSNWGSVVH